MPKETPGESRPAKRSKPPTVINVKEINDWLEKFESMLKNDFYVDSFTITGGVVGGIELEGSVTVKRKTTTQTTTPQNTTSETTVPTAPSSP